MKKKHWLLITIGVLAIIGIVIYILFHIGYLGSSTIKTNNESYAMGKQSLPIPEILEDEDPDPSKAAFTITAQKGMTEFIDGRKTETFGYNGNYLGPAIRVHRGVEVSVKVKNNLSEPTTLHWHGLKVDGEADGSPHNVIDPGDTWNPQFTVNQPAATLWFHPHYSHKTGEQVYRGLAGLFMIEDEVSESLHLPSDYGFDDIPLIIQDRRFDKNGQFDYTMKMRDTMKGMLGDTILVNGAVNPSTEVPKGLVRLRVLNGSNASVYQLHVENNQPFYQIASDGGFLEKPVKITKLELSPGERAEILVDFSTMKSGDTVRLLNNDIAFLNFVVNGTQKEVYSVPRKLTTIDKLNPKEAVKTREFIFQGMGSGVSINGKQMDMDRIDEKINYGSIEVWKINNYTNMQHPFHAHGVQFQIIERKGKRPKANEAGWKDTFIVQQGENVTVIAKFENKGTFMYHCHILEHEDAGMMGQFLVE